MLGDLFWNVIASFADVFAGWDSDYIGTPVNRERFCNLAAC